MPTNTKILIQRNVIIWKGEGASVSILKFQMEILSQFERFSHPIFIFYRLAKPTVLAENGEASHEDGKRYKIPPSWMFPSDVCRR